MQILNQRQNIFSLHRNTKNSVTINFQLTSLRICDLSPKDQHIWEQSQLNQEIDFTQCHVDPAPFQLVERTSLLKVHSLFSMMSLNHAFVTSIGKLEGVVGVKELRKAIEAANSGLLPRIKGSNDSADGESISLIEKNII